MHQNKIAKTNKLLLIDAHVQETPSTTQGTQVNEAQSTQIEHTTTTETSTTATITTQTPTTTPTRFRLYTLPSTDKTTVQGPIILTWYRDYFNLAFSAPGQFRPNTITRRHLTVNSALDAIQQLQQDRQKRYEAILSRIEAHKLKKNDTQEWQTSKTQLEETRETTQRDHMLIQKIYTIAFSAERIQGGALVFSYSDFATICLDLAGEPLPCSRFRSNQRVANRRILRTIS